MKIFHLLFSFLLISILFMYSCANEETESNETKSLDSLMIYDIDTTQLTVDTVSIHEEIDKKEITHEEIHHENAEKTVEQTKTVIEVDKTVTTIKEETDVKEEIPAETVKTTWIDKGLIINSDEGMKVTKDAPGELLGDAPSEIALVRSGECGGTDCGKIVHLQNYNSEKTIEVLVQIEWKENDEKVKKKRSYFLDAEEKVEIGCSKKCINDDKITIKWKIIGARYKK